MLLNEMYDTYVPKFQDVDEDNSQPDDTSTRKTRLTLKQINKLRQMLDLRNVEYKEDLKKIQRQYATPAPEAGGEMGF
jgi:hypothetical protein